MRLEDLIAQRKAAQAVKLGPPPRNSRRTGLAWLDQPWRDQPVLWDDASARRPGPAPVTLRQIQRQALGEIAAARGGVLPIGVGHGKTFVALLAGAAVGAKRAIVLCPPSTVPNLREALATVDRGWQVPPTSIVPYSQLSSPKSSALLREMADDVAPQDVILVADEAHCLRYASSARTKRVHRFLVEFPGVVFVAMSGTLTAKGLRDYAHLVQWALGDGAFLPAVGSAELWHLAACVDVNGRPGSFDWQWAAPVAAWGERHGIKGRWAWALASTGDRQALVRQTLRVRMVGTPGVVASDAASIGTALYVDKVELPIPSDLAAKIADCRAGECLPDGTVIDDPLEQWRVERQLSLGFWYRWDWPGGVVDDEWLFARNGWARHVRKELENRSAEGYDSPVLVFNRTAAEYRDGKRLARHLAWAEWCAVKDRPVPPTVTVWLTTEVVDRVVAEIKRDAPSIVWYEDRAIQEALRVRGVPVVPPGVDPPRTGKTCALSVRSHATGLNLQQWSQNWVLNPPSSATVWEQLIGRTHRLGQEADEVRVRVLAHTESAKQALQSATAAAVYLQDSTGNEQKLLLATVTKTVL